MKKLIFILSFSLCYPFNFYSQTGWQVVYTGTTNNLYAITAIDTNYIFICANNGEILRSSNGGLDWVRFQTGTGYSLSGVSFINKDTGFTTCSNYLYKTTNSGANWSLDHTFYGGLTDLKFFSKTNGVVLTSYFINYNYYMDCYRTTNGGINWNVYQIDQGFFTSFSSVSFPDSLNGFIATGNLFYRTANGGISWSRIVHPGSGYIAMYNFIDQNTGFIFAPPYIEKTTNRGLNFFSICTIPQGYYLAGYFINGSIGYIGRDKGPVLCTTNSGVNWITQYTNPFSKNMKRMYFVNSRLGFAIGDSGHVIRTNDGGGLYIGVNQISTEIPQWSALFQNYPNPFNPVTRIRYSVRSNSNINIAVFDIKGKRVSDLVNKRHAPGTYEVDFTGSSLSSGIYFYTLIDDGKIINTKKMLMIK